MKPFTTKRLIFLSGIYLIKISLFCDKVSFSQFFLHQKFQAFVISRCKSKAHEALLRAKPRIIRRMQKKAEMI